MAVSHLVTFIHYIIQAHNLTFFVGDKTMHEVGLNLMQVNYMASDIFITFLPILMPMVATKRMFNLSSIILTILQVPIHYVLVKYFCHAHPYTLVEDCHLIGHLWHWLYVPSAYPHPIAHAVIYSLIWTILWQALEQRLWEKLFLFLCSAISVVPSPMVEVRYYIIPQLLYAMNLPIRKDKSLLLYYYIGWMGLLMGTFFLKECRQAANPASLYYMF